MVILCREILIFYNKIIKNKNERINKLNFLFVYSLLTGFIKSEYNDAMYRQMEDVEEIARLDDERRVLANENRELKNKLERKRYKVFKLKKKHAGHVLLF